jgi:hypothetical protein
MTGRGSVLRLAQVLINEACQRLPADARQDREREWAAELAAIIDDPDIRRRWRRHLRALRFAVAQRRTVRRLTWPAGAARVRVIVARTALASAGAAVILAVAMIPLDSVVTSSSSYSYPALQAEALAGTLALAAGLLCAMLLASLGLARTMRSLRPRRPAAHAACPASGPGGAYRPDGTRGRSFPGCWPSRPRPSPGRCPPPPAIRLPSAPCSPSPLRYPPWPGWRAWSWRPSWPARLP